MRVGASGMEEGCGGTAAAAAAAAVCRVVATVGVTAVLGERNGSKGMLRLLAFLLYVNV